MPIHLRMQLPYTAYSLRVHSSHIREHFIRPRFIHLMQSGLMRYICTFEHIVKKSNVARLGGRQGVGGGGLSSCHLASAVRTARLRQVLMPAISIVLFQRPNDAKTQRVLLSEDAVVSLHASPKPHTALSARLCNHAVWT